MAKSLGQIHTITQSISANSAGYAGSVDCSGLLTNQLSRLVRAGNMFKVVGIDMTLDNFPGTTGAGNVSGHFRYYAPTRGRCAAFRGAFKAMANTMKLQGLTMRDNAMYDFTVPLSSFTPNHSNQATLDGFNGLALNHGTVAQSIFGVHNANVQPAYTGTSADLFTSGFSTLQNPAGPAIDFVLNDTVPFEGNSNIADVTYETIPFVISWDSSGTQTLETFQWRPDPALYLAILCGQLEVVIDQVSAGATQQLNISVMISGWKSIMGSPDKKPRRRSSKKKIDVQKMTNKQFSKYMGRN